MGFKKKIKGLLPDKWIYYYSIARIYPEYMRRKKDKENSISVEFYDNEKTVELIVNEGKSLGRFGDGEFMWMTGEKISSFQDYSPELARDLISAFRSKNKNLLIGIPAGIFDSSRCNLYAKMHWEIIKSSFLPRLSKFFDEKRVYCDASITRPYIDYKDREYSKKGFALLKKIWDKRDVVSVEGEKTKLGMGNDLFENVESHRRIICPSENAYSKIEEIKQSIRKNVQKDELLLGALGPTASILAAQLCEEGYQFVDIGHTDIEYMWYLNHSILREPIDGKYVNESGIKICSDLYEKDEKYQKSIIDRII